MVYLIDNLHLKSGIVCDLLSMRMQLLGQNPNLAGCVCHNPTICTGVFDLVDAFHRSDLRDPGAA